MSKILYFVSPSNKLDKTRKCRETLINADCMFSRLFFCYPSAYLALKTSCCTGIAARIHGNVVAVETGLLMYLLKYCLRCFGKMSI